MGGWPAAAGLRAAGRHAGPGAQARRLTGAAAASTRAIQVRVREGSQHADHRDDGSGSGRITKDNVTVRVDAVVYFRVVDPIRAIGNVQNYLFAVS